MVRAKVNVIRLPKTESAQDIVECEREIARIEEEIGLPVGTTKMMAAVESTAGASISIIVCPLVRGRIPCVVDRVNNIVTPGDSVDVIITEQGVAVNPKRPEIREKLKKAGIVVDDIQTLRNKALHITGTPNPIEYTNKVVGVVTYRDGSVIDVIYGLKPE